jgi:aryl-alcohol dehydrogenase-like predicted oxidoreductase
VLRALEVTVDGSRLFTSFESTWNLLEPSAGPALTEAAGAGARVIVKEAVANGLLAPGSPGSPGPVGAQPGAVGRARELAGQLGATIDQVAIAAASAQPWA